jgi:hypothetical protein
MNLKGNSIGVEKKKKNERTMVGCDGDNNTNKKEEIEEKKKLVEGEKLDEKVISVNKTPSSLSLTCAVIIELPKFLLDLDKETKLEAVKKMRKDAEAVGWKEVVGMGKDEGEKVDDKSVKNVELLSMPLSLTFHYSQ